MQAISTLDFDYLPSLLARSKGVFVQQGLDLKLLVVSVRVSVPALMSREVHFAAAGSSMPAALKGAPLKAIYYTYKTSTFQLIVRPDTKARILEFIHFESFVLFASFVVRKYSVT
jgi:ABC-type nitrate/sulfonate/bicarbonate transport system substrate-binding protein